MALRGEGNPPCTVDLEAILMLEDLEAADRIFKQNGYARLSQRERFTPHKSRKPNWGASTE